MVLAVLHREVVSGDFPRGSCHCRLFSLGVVGSALEHEEHGLDVGLSAAETYCFMAGREDADKGI